MTILGTIIIWSNGTVTAFDLDGNQAPVAQGEFRFVGPRIIENDLVAPETSVFFGGWNPPVLIPLERNALRRMVQIKGG
jgi:hypothetical protein